MKARKLIEGSIVEPDTWQVTSQAFDAAWAEIARYFDQDTEAARLRLAHAILVLT